MVLIIILTPIGVSYGPGTHCPAHTEAVAGTIDGDRVYAVTQQLSEDQEDHDGDYTGLAVVGVSGNDEGAWQYSRGNWTSEPAQDDHNNGESTACVATGSLLLCMCIVPIMNPYCLN